MKTCTKTPPLSTRARPIVRCPLCRLHTSRSVERKLSTLTPQPSTFQPSTLNPQPSGPGRDHRRCPEIFGDPSSVAHGRQTDTLRTNPSSMSRNLWRPLKCGAWKANRHTKDKRFVTVPGTDPSSLSIPPAAPTSALPPCTSCQSVLPSNDANVAPAPPAQPLPARSLARKSLHPGSLSASKKVCALITCVHAHRVNGCHGQINNGCVRKARQALCTLPATADH